MDYFLSDLLGNPIYNHTHEKVGFFRDFIVVGINKANPNVTGLVVNRPQRKEPFFIPIHDIHTISSKSFRLTTDLVDLTPFVPRQEEVLLSQDVYDKQIVDIDDRRLTRINDLLLQQNQRLLFLKGVDVSSVGILNRLKLPYFNLIKRNIVAWSDVQFLGGQNHVKFKIQYKNLQALHPVDIARIIFEGPGYRYGGKVLSQLDEPVAADIIENLSPKLQKNLIEAMKKEHVADLISHMRPNKVRDLLFTLGPEYTQKIMPQFNPKFAKLVTSLLKYPENSAGSFMTTNYLVAPSGVSIEELLHRFRELETIPDFAYYTYVLENELSNKLVGVISVHDFLKSDLRTRIDTIISKNVVFGHPQESINEVFKKMFRYDLSAIPIVSRNEGKMLGIVTLRDAMAIFLPKKWKVRLRKILTN